MAVITFDPLWKLLIDRKMSKNELAKVTGLSKSTIIAKMTNGESVTLEVVARICDHLRCSLSDFGGYTHMNYLPYIVTTKEKADSIMRGNIPFASIIPDAFKHLPDRYPLDYIKHGLKQQLQDGAIIDLSDFASSALTLLTCKPEERLRQYGDTVIVITDPLAFFERLRIVNDRLFPNLKYLYASDIVYDDELFEENIRRQVINPFVHQSVDAWKQEVMILSRVKPSVILSNDKPAEVFEIPEGISDIAVMMDLNKAIMNGLSEYQTGVNVEIYPMLTGIEMEVSGNIQNIQPEKEWIDKLKGCFDESWEAITRVVKSPDGKSEVLCLGFTDGLNTVVFQVNTIAFGFVVASNNSGSYDSQGCINIAEKVIRGAEKFCSTPFCHPSIILTSCMGEVTGDYIRNKEFEIRKSVEDRGLIHWYGLSINNLVTIGIFGVPKAGKNQWMLREQLVSPNTTLWYDADKILSFMKKAYEEIWGHMSELSPEGIVDEIIKVGGKA